MAKNKLGFSTLSVHAGESADEKTGAVVPPIYQTSTFLYPRKLEKGMESYTYTRWGNPTQKAVEEKIASLEGAEKGLVLSSGMAAISSTLLTLLKRGDHMVSVRDLYGGTFYLFTKIFPKLGIDVTYVEALNIGEIKSKIRSSTKVLFLESPTNPLLKIVDIPKAVKIAKANHLTVIIDNTFATPINQQPLKMGADLVIHSCSKYLNGHSDLIGGAVVGNDETIAKIRDMMIYMGNPMDPHAAFLLMRGLKTLALRMERHNENGLQVAKFLENHSKIIKVYYPGLSSHPQHLLAQKLMTGFGGMVSFEMVGGRKTAERFLANLHLAKVSPSLGGVETLVSMPVSTSHAELSPKERASLGISDSLVRVSLGIEDSEDIITDFRNALNAV